MKDEENAVRKKMDSRYINRIILILTLILTFVRWMLYLNTPLLALVTEKMDDGLMFEYLDHLLTGQYLGTYDSLTLSKGISYPLFLYICHKLMIPYVLGLGMLSSFSAWLFIKAIQPVLSKRFGEKSSGHSSGGVWFYECFIYVLFIYSPVTFTYLISQRMYRMAIIPSVTLLVFSAFCGLYLNRDNKMSVKIVWAFMAGAFLSFFWFIREDSIWILPFSIVLFLLLLIAALRKKILIREKIREIGVCIVPFICLLLSICMICGINQHYYGVFLTNDRTEGMFANLMELLYSIEDGDNRDVWVSRNTIEKVYENSPTFATVAPYLNRYLDECQDEAYQGEIGGDLITWTIQDAVRDAGYYETAEMAQDFYGQVYAELKQALENGSLKEENAFRLTAGARGVQRDEIWSVLKKTFLKLWDISCYKDCETNNGATSSGDAKSLRRLEGITNSRITTMPFSSCHITGWIYAKTDDAPLRITFSDGAGNVLAQPVFLPSRDVYKAFPDYLNAAQCRLDVTLYQVSPDDVVMDVFVGEELVETTKLDMRSDATGQYDVDAEAYHSDLDIVYSAGEDETLPYSMRTAKWSDRIICIYKYLSVPVTILACLCYLFATFCSIKELLRKKKFELSLQIDLWLITTGILLSAMVLCFGVVYFTRFFTTEKQIFLHFYMAGAYPLLQMWKYLSMYLSMWLFRMYQHVAKK